MMLTEPVLAQICPGEVEPCLQPIQGSQESRDHGPGEGAPLPPYVKSS